MSNSKDVPRILISLHIFISIHSIILILYYIIYLKKVYLKNFISILLEERKNRKGASGKEEERWTKRDRRWW